MARSSAITETNEVSRDEGGLDALSGTGQFRAGGVGGLPEMIDISGEQVSPREGEGRWIRRRLNRGLRRWMGYAEVDQAVVFATSNRIWQLFAGPITLLLIVRCFTPELQGYYYTFSSILALQVFVELGFTLVILNFASHEWAHLDLDCSGRIVGDPTALSRLISLGRLVFQWYAAAAGLFIVGIGLAGLHFLSSDSAPGISWQGPWCVVVVLNGFLLWALPFNALLEGCNQVATVNRFRLSQSILGSLGLWAALLCDLGLWAVVVLAATSLVRDLYLLLVHYRRFFARFWSRPPGPTLSWRTEIWPLQWRIGMAGLVNFFASSLFTPVMFHYHGPVVAGRLGMTLALVNAFLSIPITWVQVKVPAFGVLVARGEYEELDRLFARVSFAALSVLIFGAVTSWLGVYCLNLWECSLALRFLGPLPTGLFLIAALLVFISACFVNYLRAHKREPTVALNVFCGLAVGLMVWLLGSRYGPTGAASGYAGVYFLAVIWAYLIWTRSRSAWHSTRDDSTP